MPSMRDIKLRIESVTSTGQIIRAMDSIASSKLHKAQAQLRGAIPILDGLQETLDKLSQFDGVEDHPFFAKRPVKNILYIVLTSNQGFAGGFNANISNLALEHMAEHTAGKKSAGFPQEHIIVGGKKGETFFKRHKKNIIRTVTDFPESQIYHTTEASSAWLASEFREEHYDEIYVCYTHFENVLSHQPRVEKLLPLDYHKPDHSAKEAIYSPSIATVLDNMVPLYLHMVLFNSYSDSHTSEQAARMVTMNTAGKNAEELIDQLNLQFNRERQGAITQELTEIVSGNSAKKKRTRK